MTILLSSKIFSLTNRGVNYTYQHSVCTVDKNAVSAEHICESLMQNSQSNDCKVLASLDENRNYGMGKPTDDDQYVIYRSSLKHSCVLQIIRL